MTAAPHKAVVQRQFGASAPEYATSRVHADRASLARLVDLVGPSAGWRALDVATGAGHTALAFAPHVASVVATDITPEMLAVVARAIAARGTGNVTTRAADAEALPFGEGSFELVTCRIAPHHFPRVDLFLAEALRVLTPGGVLAVVDNFAPDDEEAARELDAIERLRDPSHVHCLRLGEWRAAIRAAGFELVHEAVDAKRLEFLDWARRMQVSDVVARELRRRLLDARPALAAFLRPEADGDDVRFVLGEAAFIGRKPA